MKRFFFLIIILLLGAGIYFDLSIGTLPEAETTPQKNETAKIPYEEVTVQAGYTVLSIVEHLHGKELPVPIEQVIRDFQELNPNIHPEEIQVGKTYLFPIYSEDN